MKINTNHLAREGGDAAGDFLKDMRHRCNNVKEASEEHVENFSKYHHGLVKNIEKELNRSQL